MDKAAARAPEQVEQAQALERLAAERVVPARAAPVVARAVDQAAVDPEEVVAEEEVVAAAAKRASHGKAPALIRGFSLLAMMNVSQPGMTILVGKDAPLHPASIVGNTPARGRRRRARFGLHYVRARRLREPEISWSTNADGLARARKAGRHGGEGDREYD